MAIKRNAIGTLRYCGDDSIWDVEGSYAVGMTPVWFRGAIDYEQPIPAVDHIGVQDWAELVEIIERLVSNDGKCGIM